MLNPSPHQDKEGVQIFDQAVRDNLTDFGAAEGLKLTKLQECQWAIWSDSLCFKIYLPDCHMFSIDVTISPKFSEKWLDASEIPIVYFYEFMGRSDRFSDKGLKRYSRQEIAGGIIEIKGYMREIINDFAYPRKEPLWSSFQKFREEQLNGHARIGCKALPQDAYPAGLFLAYSLWARIKNDPKPMPIEISAIKSFWDGVKVLGKFKNREFEVEINYANNDVVMLFITIKKSWFLRQWSRSRSARELKHCLEKIVFSLEGRK